MPSSPLHRTINMLLIVPLVDIFHGTALTISTSLTSKIVDNDELGRYTNYNVTLLYIYYIYLYFTFLIAFKICYVVIVYLY